MPLKMSWKCFIIFFANFITLVTSQISFIDCGSILEIRDVEVMGCPQSPCSFSPGGNVTVEIDLSQAGEIGAQELYTEAYISMYGQRWPLIISPVNPCIQWACPHIQLDNLTYIARNTFRRKPYEEACRGGDD
ncbi:hypothetical protein NQ318_018726 [Aromia moschata]|uniref:MD-2-related lipid-recognition domain-containing protein n=1 Tax=Aromia moschata TaxID=1265417 RepID=A0AAV8ZIT7_9CUCU|nr:hypothetical protein NQ318_018726 [Aromia moschata]